MARVLLFGASLCLVACQGSAGRPVQGNLLHGRKPMAVLHVAHPERINDGLVPRGGDPWLSSLSAVFQHARAYVLYDLGATRQIAAVHVQGDNNDRFLVELSNDGRAFTLLWEAPAVPGALSAETIRSGPTRSDPLERLLLVSLVSSTAPAASDCAITK